jgi:hypothetical protein
VRLPYWVLRLPRWVLRWASVHHGWLALRDVLLRVVVNIKDGDISMYTSTSSLRFKNKYGYFFGGVENAKTSNRILRYAIVYFWRDDFGENTVGR